MLTAYEGTRIVWSALSIKGTIVNQTPTGPSLIHRRAADEIMDSGTLGVNLSKRMTSSWYAAAWSVSCRAPDRVRPHPARATFDEPGTWVQAASERMLQERNGADELITKPSVRLDAGCPQPLALNNRFSEPGEMHSSRTLRLAPVLRWRKRVIGVGQSRDRPD
jgi:hypothetical protein